MQKRRCHHPNYAKFYGELRVLERLAFLTDHAKRRCEAEGRAYTPQLLSVMQWIQNRERELLPNVLDRFTDLP